MIAAYGMLTDSLGAAWFITVIVLRLTEQDTGVPVGSAFCAAT